METINLLKRQNKFLKSENQKLKKQQKALPNKFKEFLVTDERIKEKLLAVERENNELDMKLKALNSQSKQEVQPLREELHISNISTGRSIVHEVQVSALENKVDHLECNLKKVKEETTVMEHNLNHYKSKAQQWRNKAIKYEHYAEKYKNDVESLRKENSQLRSRLDEKNVKIEIEIQRFDLGHTQEDMEKLEKEKKDYINEYSCSPNHKPVSSRHFKLPTIKECETEITEGTETQSSFGPIRLGMGRRRSLSNPVVLPSQKRVAHQFGVGSAAQAQQVDDGDKVPMQQMVGKENKYYSKCYSQSTGSRRKSEECKQQ